MLFCFWVGVCVNNSVIIGVFLLVMAKYWQ